MENITKFVSNIFKYAIYISLFFLWINYYYRNIYFALFLAVIISIIVDKIIQIIISKKNKYTLLKKEEQSKIKEYSIQFLCSTKFENINYFTTLFNNPNIKKTKDYFIINDTTFLPYYYKSQLDNDDIYTIYRSYNIKTSKLVVLCVSISDTANVLAKSISNYQMIVLNENDAYTKFLKPLTATLPGTIIFKKDTKLKLKDLVSISLNRHSAKGYFFSGFIILISSLFIRYKIYYIVFATLLFVLSYISYFNTWYNKSTPNDFI
jgi:uncharacterized membrane protein